MNANSLAILLFLGVLAIVLIFGARLAIWVYDRTRLPQALVCREAQRAADDDDDDWGRA